MPRQLLLFLLSLVCCTINAQPDTASGYLLRVQGDTLYRRILVCEGFRANQPGGCFSDAVVVLDADSTRIFDTGELFGFGFKWMTRIVHYRSLQTEKSKDPYFAPVSILGNRLTLFEQSRGASVPSGLMLPAYGSPNTPMRGVTIRNYFIRDSKGNTLKLPDIGRDELRRRIKKFLKDQPELLPLVDEFVTGLLSIPVFVREVNKAPLPVTATGAAH
ncbi:MAG: hypothetical protein EOO15_19180 [Chitinophagaceae bacterium]|nr:MAG: hypothetical protein EOO15_19180 [Chitinophagaceae bacterium]